MTDYLTLRETAEFMYVYACFALYERGVIRMAEACFNSLTRVSNVEPVAY